MGVVQSGNQRAVLNAVRLEGLEPEEHGDDRAELGVGFVAVNHFGGIHKGLNTGPRRFKTTGWCAEFLVGEVCRRILLAILEDGGDDRVLARCGDSIARGETALLEVEIQPREPAPRGVARGARAPGHDVDDLDLGSIRFHDGGQRQRE